MHENVSCPLSRLPPSAAGAGVRVSGRLPGLRPIRLYRIRTRITGTRIAFANERAIIADMLISLLSNVRLTYLPDLEPADAHELLLTGAHVLIAQLGSQPATAAEISRVIGRPRDDVLQWLDELIKRGYVERSGNRYKMTTKFNVPNLQRHMRSNINMIQAAAKRLGAHA